MGRAGAEEQRCAPLERFWGIVGAGATGGCVERYCWLRRWRLGLRDLRVLNGPLAGGRLWLAIASGWRFLRRQERCRVAGVVRVVVRAD